MSELRTRGKALVEAAPAASPAVELERSASQSSLLMPSKPVKGRKRSSSNVGQSRALVPLTKEYLLRALPSSSERIAAAQARFRTPWADKVFLWSGMLGAVGFFMCFLPAFFFFGLGPEGRELVTTLALGIYLTSLIKDIAQIPRPLAPPVTRLSLEYHALEYGFPSSHCASTTTFAVFYFLMLARAGGFAGSLGSFGGVVIFGLWVLVCLGRMYCGMHTAIDCAAGVTVGLVLSLAFAGLRAQWEAFLSSASVTTPLVLALLMLAICTVRPDPPIPSVSYPDAIAFTAVVLGVSAGRWVEVVGGWDFASDGVGHGWVARDAGASLAAQVGSHVAKYVVGVVCIIVYRVGAKVVLEQAYAVVLGPPRLYSPASTPNSSAASAQSSPLILPSSRLPATTTTATTAVDPPTRASSSAAAPPGPLGLTPLEVRSEPVPLLDGGLATPPARGNEAERLEWERKKAEGRKRNLTAGEGESLKSGRQVFTKVMVYGGIGFIAAFVLPLSFIRAGVGLR